MMPSPVRVVNDTVDRGRFGEKVLWTYLTDDLGYERQDFESTGARSWLDLKIRCHELTKPALGIQNATWAPPRTAGDCPYVAILQDNIRGMWNDPVPQHATLEGAKIIVCNGAQIAEDYAEYDRPTPRIRIIPIGIDTKFWAPDPVGSGLRERKKVIFVGDEGPQKGYDHVIELARARRDVDWTFVCKTAAHGAHELGRVRIAISQAEVRDELRRADAFVLASPVETQCLAALEAMACGLPVVMPTTGVFYDWRPPSFCEAGLPSSLPHFDASLTRALALVGRVDARSDLLKESRFTVAAMLAAWKALIQELLDQ